MNDPNTHRAVLNDIPLCHFLSGFLWEHIRATASRCTSIHVLQEYSLAYLTAGRLGEIQQRWI